MPFLTFDNVAIAAMAAAVPSHVQTLEEANRTMPAQVRSFEKLTGVRQRHISVTRQTALDLGVHAARQALARAGWGPDSLDGVIFLSQTPDFNAGTGNAFLAHHLLSLKADCLAFDIPLACSSFCYGLSVAASLVARPGVSRLAFLSGDTQWHFYPDGIPKALPDGGFMFGEAATAVLLEKNDHAHPMHISLFTDGSGYKYLFNPLGGCRNAWEKARVLRLPNGDIHHVSGKFGYMDGLEVTSFTTTRVVRDIQDFMTRIGHSPADYDSIILHQANRQIIRTIAKRLGISPDSLPSTLDRYGNTSGASSPLTIIDAYAGCDKPDVFLLASAFGTGLSWGVASFHLAPSVIAPIATCDDRFDEGIAVPAENGR